MVQIVSFSRKLLQQVIIIAAPQLFLLSSSRSFSAAANTATSHLASPSLSSEFQSLPCSFIIPFRQSLLQSQSQLHHQSAVQHKYQQRNRATFLTTATDSNTNTSYKDMRNPNNNPSNKCPRVTQSVRIVSYNLLSSHLAEPTYHTKCKPQNLDAKVRFSKIIDKLKQEIDTHNDNDASDGNSHIPVVFCLQEVSHDWAKQLHVFFANNGYHFITALYGRNFNGYMGIGTAYPTQYYETLNVDLCRLSDTRKGGWPRPREGIDDDDDDNNMQRPGLVSRLFVKPMVQMAQYVGLASSPSLFKPAVNPWKYSEYRYNEFIAVQLQRRHHKINRESATATTTNNNNQSNLWIGNYHMPCAFRDPAVMTIHCDLVASRIQSLAANNSNNNHDPFILAGDFNIQPDSPQYHFLTTGTLNEKDELHSSSYPPVRYGREWESNVKKMKSAYALHHPNNQEPDCTNYSHNGAVSEDSFIGTLDYIFLSDHSESLSNSDSVTLDDDQDRCHDWKVKDVLALKHRDEIKDGPFPNEDEPSDHVMIAATLEI